MKGTSNSAPCPTESSRLMRGVRVTAGLIPPGASHRTVISRLRRKNLRYTGQSMDVLYEAGIVRDL